MAGRPPGPAADQAARHSWTRATRSGPTSGQERLADGVTYDWQVRGTDALTTGPWSGTCRFSTDFTPPATAPVVTSADYPSGGPPTGSGGVGEPGVFTFDAQGDPDIVRFAVGESVPPVYVAADRPGGKATYTFTPQIQRLEPAGGARGRRGRQQLAQHVPTGSTWPATARR